MKVTRQFIKRNGSLLTFGFLFTLFSSFGQTFLISLYVPHLQGEFGLSDSLFSGIYSAATLASAFTITWLGKFIDKIVLTKFSVRVLIGLCFALLFLSQAYHVIMLFFALYLVRLFGQGMMTHTSITSMARFFGKNRGKAISVAALGHPAGEAVLPIIIVSSIFYIGWRGTLIGSAVLAAAMIPLTLYLLLKNKSFSRLKMFLPSMSATEEEKKEVKTTRLLSNRTFWVLAPTVMMSAGFGTGYLFFQLKLGEMKGWTPEFIAAAFSAYAIGNALTTLLGGWLSDHFNGRRLYPFILIPFGIGLLALIFFNHWLVFIILIAGIGITNGFGNAVKNTAMAELFGIKMIGSVRSLFITLMVFSTALGPVLFGVMLDSGYTFEHISILAFAMFFLVTLNSLRILKFEPKVE